jgi:glycosyltransferase involved in cell wall biosynthesis
VKIRLIGQRNNTGIGIHYACFADQLKQIQGIGKCVEEIDFQNSEQVEQAIADSCPEDINISFVAANISDCFQGRNIQWIVFESTRIAEHIMKVLIPADQVWVPSEWGRKVLIDNGLDADKIFVVPEGVEANRYHTHGRQLWAPGRPLRFLSVGKYEQRKSFDELLDAWATTYATMPNVELVIKTHHFSDHDAKYQQLQDKLAQLNLPNVTVIWGELSKDDMVELYRNCDVFVFPTKGEGWGLPIIEATACGLPIVTTFYSGHTEFLNHIEDSVVKINYALADIADPEFQACYPDSNNDWGQWAIPDTQGIVWGLQTALGNRKQLAENAQKNSQKIRDLFGWTASVDRALAVMGLLTDFKP